MLSKNIKKELLKILTLLFQLKTPEEYQIFMTFKL